MRRAEHDRGGCPAMSGDAAIRRGAAARGRRRLLCGFTLLEVMVALLVLALALVALLRLSGLEARALAQVRDGSYAQWVAANALAEVRLQTGVPAAGRSEGRARMGRQRWRWQLDVEATEDPGVLRLEVRVFPEDARSGEPVARLTGFYRP